MSALTNFRVNQMSVFRFCIVVMTLFAAPATAADFLCELANYRGQAGFRGNGIEAKQSMEHWLPPESFHVRLLPTEAKAWIGQVPSTSVEVKSDHIEANFKPGDFFENAPIKNWTWKLRYYETTRKVIVELKMRKPGYETGRGRADGYCSPT